MRIGLAIETDSPGGAETMLLQLARELLARGHEVVGLGPVGGEGWLTERLAEIGVERDLVEFRGLFQMGTIPQVAAVVRKRDLDVLHSHEFGMAFCGAVATRLRRTRHIITMHGGTYYATAARRRYGLRVAASLSDRLVVVSEASRQALAPSLGLGVEAVDVVHNGVAAVTARETRVREELGVGPSDHLVVAVGNLLPVKGHAVLVRALGALGEDVGRVVLAIAGRGPEEGPLTELAAQVGLDGDLKLLGYRSDIPELLAAADLFAMPSLSEGMPMAMIEAMLAGRPILASDAGGIHELIPSDEYGVLVPPGDPSALAARLRELLRAPELRARLGGAARERALIHFTAAAMADRYLEMYAG